MSIQERQMQHMFSSAARSEIGQSVTVFWAALLALSAIGSSWALACVTPFAAFALVSARTLPFKTALGTVALIWLANQTVGFLFLNYPLTISCVAWGLAMGAASLAATSAVAAIMRLKISTPGQLFLGSVAAFSVYEGSLMVMGLATQSMEGFTTPIIGNFLLTNVVWSAGLLIVYALIERVSAMKRLTRRRAF